MILKPNGSGKMVISGLITDKKLAEAESEVIGTFICRGIG